MPLHHLNQFYHHQMLDIPKRLLEIIAHLRIRCWISVQPHPCLSVIIESYQIVVDLKVPHVFVQALEPYGSISHDGQPLDNGDRCQGVKAGRDSLGYHLDLCVPETVNSLLRHHSLINPDEIVIVILPQGVDEQLIFERVIRAQQDLMLFKMMPSSQVLPIGGCDSILEVVMLGVVGGDVLSVSVPVQSVDSAHEFLKSLGKQLELKQYFSQKHILIKDSITRQPSLQLFDRFFMSYQQNYSDLNCLPQVLVLVLDEEVPVVPHSGRWDLGTQLVPQHGRRGAVTAAPTVHIVSHRFPTEYTHNIVLFQSVTEDISLFTQVPHHHISFRLEISLDPLLSVDQSADHLVSERVYQGNISRDVHQSSFVLELVGQIVDIDIGKRSEGFAQVVLYSCIQLLGLREELADILLCGLPLRQVGHISELIKLSPQIIDPIDLLLNSRNLIQQNS